MPIRQPPVGRALRAAHPLAQGLTAYWPLNEGGGFKAVNLMRPVVDTVNGATPAAGYGGGYSRLFGASSGTIDLDGTAYLTAGKPYTISWWERITTDTNPYVARFALPISGAATSFQCIRAKSDANWIYLGWGQAGNPSLHVPTAPSTTACVGLWMHFVIAGTDPTSQTAGNHVCYVNGVAYAVVAGVSSGSTTVAKLGNDGTAGRGADCRLQNVRIYNRQLTQREIRTLYTDPFAGLAIRQHPRKFISAVFGPPTQLLVTAQPTTAITQRAMGNFRVAVADAAGATVATNTSNVTATITVTHGLARFTGTFTVAAVAGIATFTDLTPLCTDGATWTITFTDGALTAAVSVTVTGAVRSNDCAVTAS